MFSHIYPALGAVRLRGEEPR